MDDLSTLAKVPFFSILEPSELAALSSRLQPRTYPEEHQLFLQGDSGSEMYIILTGAVRICRETLSGREVTLAIRGPGDFIGEMVLLDGAPRSASGYAHGGPCECIVLTGESFHRFVESHPSLSRRLLGFLSERLREAADRLEEMATHTVRQRLAALLSKIALEQGENGNPGILLPETVHYRFLSGLLGTIRESVSRAASELVKLELLDKVGRRFRIRNLEKLQRLAREGDDFSS